MAGVFFTMFCKPFLSPLYSLINLNTQEIPARAQPGLASWLFGSGDDEGEEPQPVDVTTQVRGCEIRGNFYERGALVEESSGPCLECR